MDELVPYIIKNYSHLMTLYEHLAYGSIQIGGKIENASSEAINASRVDALIAKDLRVKGLLKNGPEAFLQSLCDRILREHAEQVVVNRCPKCGGLARTPEAKQCPKCFHSWRDHELLHSQTTERNQGIQQ
jgi:hypothetical protein